ncbi:ribosome silencing factor [Oceanibaculum pacificum]|uniref:Ribosomal silencing factor RsfS n=1 Tax=Oceanibaculum pacificum TaxID=580166 RepID=A0A154W4I9_9PROT|nr:ribosome silencing factor [Oceanibaculum pacificum]KZD08371.1 ribosome-associated protein IOJAP [Oceanibaculum pacificum]
MMEGKRTRKLAPKLAHQESKQWLDLVVKSLDDDKAEDVIVIDLAGKSSFADYMVIASGRSTRQVSAIADHLMERLKAAGIGSVAAEGMTQGDWVLIDGGDVVVHLFRPEVRAFYNLEKMWGLELPASAAVSTIAVTA